MGVYLTCDRCGQAMFGDKQGTPQLAFDAELVTWSVKRHPNDALALQRDGAARKTALQLCGSCASSLREWAKPTERAEAA